ncbi:hypothetical protein LTS18_007908 [Coniosporium uncinatum]|uniref:Uncharacterized protein n=1 Tax=Coniosporium uncinatum TaxID=93489 RepID=A0ACC3DX51_9PEZI|nr:hypothetical protein LTS18_007908 [Coniosporium uncinatum]
MSAAFANVVSAEHNHKSAFVSTSARPSASISSSERHISFAHPEHEYAANPLPMSRLSKAWRAVKKATKEHHESSNAAFEALYGAHGRQYAQYAH